MTTEEQLAESDAIELTAEEYAMAAYTSPDGHMFTVDAVERIKASAYDAGFQASSEGEGAR